MNHENDTDLVSKVERDLLQIRSLINRKPLEEENGPLTKLQLRHLTADSTNNDVNAELLNFEKLYGLYDKLKNDANEKLRELKVMMKEGKEVYEITGKLLDSLNHEKTNDGRNSEILDGITCYNIDNHLRGNEMKMQRAIKSTEGSRSLRDSLVRYQKIFKVTKSELDLLGSRCPLKEEENEGKSKKSISFRHFVREASSLSLSDNERNAKITKLMSEIDVFMDEKRKAHRITQEIGKETKDAE